MSDEEDMPILLNPKLAAAAAEAAAAAAAALATPAPKATQQQAKPAAAKAVAGPNPLPPPPPPLLAFTGGAPPATKKTKAPVKPATVDDDDAPPNLRPQASKQQQQQQPAQPQPVVEEPKNLFSVKIKTGEFKTCLILLADRNNSATLRFQANQLEMSTSDRDSPDFSSITFSKKGGGMEYFAPPATGAGVTISLSNSTRQQLIRELHSHESLHTWVHFSYTPDRVRGFQVDIFTNAVYTPEYKVLASKDTASTSTSSATSIGHVKRVDLNATHLANIIAQLSQFTNLVDFTLERESLGVSCAGGNGPVWALAFSDKQQAYSTPKILVKNLPVQRLLDLLTRASRFTPNCTVQFNEGFSSITILFEVPDRFSATFFVKERKLGKA